MAVKQLIERVELTSSASSITFSSIPQTFAQLFLVSSARTTRSAVNDQIKGSFNGNTSGQSNLELVGNGSAPASYSSSFLYVGHATGASATSNTFGNSSCYISNYTSSNSKSASVDAVTENNATSVVLTLVGTLDTTTTSAVTSLVLTSQNSADFVSGSSFSLYGITRGGDGTVTTA